MSLINKGTKGDCARTVLCFKLRLCSMVMVGMVTCSEVSSVLTRFAEESERCCATGILYTDGIYWGYMFVQAC